MKNEFDSLVATCESELKKVALDSAEFPLVAKKILDETQFNPSLRDLEIPLLWGSKQHFKNNDFSEFPLTLHHWGDFHLDLYLWKEGRTGIHDHHFQGAFKVLKGDYVQSRFSFDDELPFLPLITKGTIRSELTGKIKEGASHTISMGDQYIHSVHHASPINVTMCLRTKDLKTNLNSYLLPGFKISAPPAAETVVKKLDFAWFMFMEFDQESSLINEIEIHDLLLFSEKKIGSVPDFEKWWKYVLKVDKRPELIEIKNALRKTKFL